MSSRELTFYEEAKNFETKASHILNEIDLTAEEIYDLAKTGLRIIDKASKEISKVREEQNTMPDPKENVNPATPRILYICDRRACGHCIWSQDDGC